MFTLVSANVNGIRAAARRDGLAWLRSSGADAICLQEVRADDETLTKVLAEGGMGDWSYVHAASCEPGRAGVAILARQELQNKVNSVGRAEFAESGRWVEATVNSPLGPITLISTYVHTGETGTPRQKQKYRFLAAAEKRITELVAEPSSQVLLTGDLNIARSHLDIKNWKGNVGKAGFLPLEQKYLDRWMTNGWVDLGREFAGEQPGPYTWWSWRGQAFDNDAGWRIDYVLGSRAIAQKLTNVSVVKAPTYAKRWSDHAPVVATFNDQLR